MFQPIIIDINTITLNQIPDIMITIEEFDDYWNHTFQD